MSATKTTKDKLFGFLACGSGKKNRPLSDQNDAPEEKPEDDENVDRSVVNVKAYEGHSHTTPNKKSVKNEEDENESGLVDLSYSDLKLIGKGTFGVVYRAKLFETMELIAIKKVFDDKRYKNRELLFMRRLQHPNVCDLKYYFYSEDPGCRKGERFLNMVLEYVPKTLFTIAKCDGTFTKPLLDPSYIKVYIYQLFRSLQYLHSMNICHRDIKPQNMLINPATHEVKLCDFGSSKELLKNESNVAYICSRYYRAPELILGAKDYTCRIDLWSAGCILGELYLGHPIFPGASGPDQMVEIMKILGTPTYEDIRAINHNCKDMVFPPTLVPMSWSKVFTKSIPCPDAMNLISRLLLFNPEKRLTGLEAITHPFFQALKSRNFVLPDGKSPPNLFDFTPEELEYSPTMKEILQPNDWEKENDEYLHQHTPNSTGNENLKSKIVNLARNSFRKASFRREKNDNRSNDFQAPAPYQFEESDVEIGEYGGEGEDGYYDEQGRRDEVDDDFTDDIQNLNMEEADRHGMGERRGVVEEDEIKEEIKKKKKKKKSKSHHPGDEDGDGEISIGDGGVDVIVGGEDEVKIKKKKKKKKVVDGVSYEGSYDDNRNENDDVVVHDEGVRKKERKVKTKDYEETVVEVSRHETRSTRRAKKQMDELEVSNNEGNVAGMDVAEIKKRKKKKRNESHEDEV